jgi:ribosome-associated protein
MNREQLLKEIKFSFSRSGGPGGQHANKVSTKANAALDIMNSMAFTSAEKERLLRKLDTKLSADGELRMSCDSTRSQADNKRIVTERLLDLIEEKIKVVKKRVPTKTPRSVKERRLDKKRQQAYKKAMRKKPKQD